MFAEVSFPPCMEMMYRSVTVPYLITGAGFDGGGNILFCGCGGIVERQPAGKERGESR